MTEERGCHMRLVADESLDPASVLRDSRAALAAKTIPFEWEPVFSYCFKKRQHINVLEVEAVCSLVKRLGRARGGQRLRYTILVDSKVALGAIAKGRSSSRQLTEC